jgi:hypothetical protein
MLPPGPRGVPILGMLPAIRRNPTAVFMKAARRYGEVSFFKIGPRRGFLITNPSDIKHVLRTTRATIRRARSIRSCGSRSATGC